MDSFSAHDEASVRALLPPGGFGDILYRDFEHAVYRLRVPEFSASEPFKRFPDATLKALARRCRLTTLTASRDIVDESGTTTRILLDAADGCPVESVVMRHAGERNTVCVSSQSGCAMGCAFCATGHGGLRRNLAYWEIIDQVAFASRALAMEGKKLRNVVFMGMGEPLANYGNVVAAIRILTSTRKFGLAQKHVTVSTCGLAEGIRRLSEDFPNVPVILSLHAPDEETRQRLMPVAKSSTAGELVALMGAIAEKKRHRGLIAYLMIKDVTDTPRQATMLAELLKGHNVQVNFIPYNPIGSIADAAPEFLPSNRDRIGAFRETLKGAGIPSTVRATMGDGIESACGQLARKPKN